MLKAELMGIWQGLQISKEMGINHLIIESDSEVALHIIQKPKQDWNWELHILLSKIIQLCNNREVRLAHIFREGNSLVDALANLALSQTSLVIYQPADLPIRARQLAYHDKNGLFYVRRFLIG